MSHHDGTKPYQPRRGRERHPQQTDEVAAPPAPAAVAEARNRYAQENHQHQQQLLQGQGHEQVGEEEEEEDDEMDPHSAMVPGTVPPMATNQLILSFQGEVYVFDSVSPAKFQAVLLLLGGRELNHTRLGGTSSSPYSKVRT